MRKRIFRGAILFSLIAAVLMGALASLAAHRLAEEQLAARLWQELELISSLRDQYRDDKDFMALLSQTSVADRLTWIAPDGTVLYDNQSNPRQMENHGDRQEVVQARESGRGMAKRYSNTLLEERLYCAMALADGGVLRASATQRTIGGYMGRLGLVMALGAAVVCGLAAALSRGWTLRLVRPINQIDLEHPLNHQVYDELSPMLRRMEEQNRKLEAQWKELSERQNELNAILSHMEEGLVFLDRQSHVLMMNDSARGILHTSRPVDGSTALAVYNRSQTLMQAVHAAMEQGNAHAQMYAMGREYLLTASAVKDADCLVLLMQDVTEQNAAEQSRKRFSANVSHELRTPLTTISGYAELMHSGMAQEQDIPVFARKIYEESRRLLQLIEDIMRLSKLDEGYQAGHMEPTELLSAATAAAEENAELARERDVTVSVSGDEAVIPGDPTLLDEMLRNLIENGIKYNRAGGQVRVRVSGEGSRVRVTVEDDGIGIPQEHVGRVFERFYRVDKSRSKQTGGTGLGLSIVKHGAEYHRAELKLDSVAGEGTKVTLVFEKQKSGVE